MDGNHKVATELGLLALLLVTGLILANPDVLLLALPIVVHVALGLVLCNQGDALSVRRSLSAHRVYEGDRLDVELVVEKPSQGPDLMLITEETALARHVVEGSTNLAEWVPGGGALVAAYTIQPPRGFYPLQKARVYARDLLGFITWERDVPCPTLLWTLPRYERIGRVMLTPRRTLSLPGAARSRRGGVGVQFFATRPYVPGDDLRRLNWKALARCGKLVVNLYEEERAAEVTVVLDGRERTYQIPNGREAFDQAVRACAALCDSAIRDGHRTGLLLYGERLEWVPAGTGRTHSERLLQGLAKADLGSSEVFADLGNLPASLFAGGSSVIIVSAFAPGDEQALGMLRARGYDVLALVPNVPLSERAGQTSSGLAERLLSLEREVMLQVLMSAGVRVSVWDVDTPLSSLVKGAWRRRL
jgi:uncharacterized protein (DUF58 family)